MNNDEIQKLRQEVEKLNAHRFITVHNSIPRLLAFQFARGLFFGLGSVLGATVVVSILVYLLSQIDFIPVLGDWADQIIQEIQGEN